jgi:hypothetical protein
VGPPKHEDVEKLGAGSRTEGTQTLPQGRRSGSSRRIVQETTQRCHGSLRGGAVGSWRGDALGSIQDRRKDAWRLTDNLAADLESFARNLMHVSAVREVIHFPVVSVHDAPTYVLGFVSLRMEEIVDGISRGLPMRLRRPRCGLKWKVPPEASESATVAAKSPPMNL